MDKLVEVGKQLGLEGDKLHHFVIEQQEKERSDRAYRRDYEREMDERKRAHEMALKEAELEIAKLNAATASKSGQSAVKVKLPKLAPFNETKDDMDSFLFRFEKYVKAQNLKEEDWAMSLSALLSGDALEVYRRLGKDDSDSYEKLKKALLKRYELTEEGFRNKFRDTKIQRGETPTQFMDRLRNYFERWIEFGEIEKSFDALLDLMLREQFVLNCNKPLAVFLKERIPKTSKEMACLAEQYVEARGETNCSIVDHAPSRYKTNKTDNHGNLNIDSKVMAKPNHSDKTCYKCGRKGHIQRNCKVKEKVAMATQQNGNQDLENETQETGATCMMHLLSDSIENNHLKLATGETLPIISGACGQGNFSKKSNLPMFKGKVGDLMVDTLRDSGCTGVVVQSSLVKPEQLTGKVHLCILIDGTVKKVPMAKIHVDTPFYVGDVEAMSMENPIYPLVLGNIPGIRSPSDPNLDWNSTVVKEPIAVLTRAQTEKLKKPITPLKFPGEIDLSLTPEEFKKEQLNDSSLKFLWEMTKDSKLIRLKNGSQSRHLDQNGILKWKSVVGKKWTSSL